MFGHFARLFVLIIIQAICVVGAQAFLKLALNRIGDFVMSWECIKHALSVWQLYVAGILALTGVGEWMYVLKHYDFSLAYPLTSISFIVSLFCAWLMFGETIPVTRWIGVVIICIGVYFVAK
ncbi:MAG: EamA family transporter [Bacteroidales bacterium]|nr:EamA family transporter [Bacteroidales bacterium]